MKEHRTSSENGLGDGQDCEAMRLAIAQNNELEGRRDPRAKQTINGT